MNSVVFGGKSQRSLTLSPDVDGCIPPKRSGDLSTVNFGFWFIILTSSFNKVVPRFCCGRTDSLISLFSFFLFFHIYLIWKENVRVLILSWVEGYSILWKICGHQAVIPIFNFSFSLLHCHFFALSLPFSFTDSDFMNHLCLVLISLKKKC